MKRLGVSLKLAAVFAVVACAFAGTAASALAVSIEPLSTKFEGVSRKSSSVTWKVGGGTWPCEKASFAGTTNSTKTNFMEVTPAFSGCTAAGAVVEYKTVCVKKGTVPWVLTLNTGGSVTLKLNCYLETKIPNAACTIEAPPQTVESGLSWANDEGGKSLDLNVREARLKSLTSSEGCFIFTKGAEEEQWSAEYLIKGIHTS